MTTTPAILRWEDPPSRHPLQQRFPTDRTGPWEPVADALRDHPNKWAVVFEGNHSRASYLAWVIRKGALQGFEPGGDFEARTARLSGGVTAVYARATE